MRVLFLKAQQSRAKKGGERGVNGEWYEGGKFLPSTQAPKRAPQRGRGTGGVLVEPGKLDVPPDGLRAIYTLIREFVEPDGHGGVRIQDRFTADHPAIAHYWNGNRAELQGLVDRFNRGDRWI